MVYDDYADIGIFAKWVMDAPGIGERAHPALRDLFLYGGAVYRMVLPRYASYA